MSDSISSESILSVQSDNFKGGMGGQTYIIGACCIFYCTTLIMCITIICLISNKTNCG